MFLQLMTKKIKFPLEKRTIPKQAVADESKLIRKNSFMKWKNIKNQSTKKIWKHKKAREVLLNALYRRKAWLETDLILFFLEYLITDHIAELEKPINLCDIEWAISRLRHGKV